MTGIDEGDLDEEDFVCSIHVDNEFLAFHIDSLIKGNDDDFDQCALCLYELGSGADGVNDGVLVNSLVELAVDGVARFFERANDAGVPFEDGNFTQGVSTEEMIEDELDLSPSSPVFGACWRRLGDDWWVRENWDGREDFDLDGDRYSPIDHSRPNLSLFGTWDDFKSYVSHESRFLLKSTFAGGGAHDFLDGLLDVLVGRTAMLHPGESLYRARSFHDGDTWDRSDPGQYSSPPPMVASQGRMNPAGVAMFYGASDLDTAAAEVYDGKEFAAVAEFTPLRELKVLDLTRLPPPSLMNPDHTEYSMFLHGFAEEVARPIRRDDLVHIEYVPTQVVTEYIRFAKAGFDGILFTSSRTGGRNVVVFANSAETLGGGNALLAPTGPIRKCRFSAPKPIEWDQVRPDGK